MAQPGHNFRQILRLHRVRHVKRLDHLLFVVTTFLRLVRNHKNNVFRDRLPEYFALQRNDVQRLFQCHIVQFRGDAARRQVRVVNDRQSRQFGNGIEHDFRIVGHLQIDRRMRQWLDFRRHGRQRMFIRVWRHFRRRVRCAILI